MHNRNITGEFYTTIMSYDGTCSYAAKVLQVQYQVEVAGIKEEQQLPRVPGKWQLLVQSGHKGICGLVPWWHKQSAHRALGVLPHPGPGVHGAQLVAITSHT